MKKLSFILATALMAVLGACNKGSDGDDTSNDLNRKNMLMQYADNYIIPAYADMNTAMANLKSSTELFLTAPNEAKLAILQQNWRTAYTTWQRIEMLEFGPAEDASLRMYMNIYPASVSKINNNIVTGTYNLDAFSSTDVQGFPALDYLLNGLATTPADLVSFYTTEPQAANRKKYVQDVVNKMSEKLIAVSNAWTSYQSTFAEATGTDVNSSISKMTNAYVLYFERYLRSGKIGLPAGAMTGTALPTLTEAYYSPGLANDLARTAMNAVRDFYEGKSYDGTGDGVGMRDYLAAIGTKDNDQLIADIITEEMNQAMNALNMLNTPISEAVVNNRPAVLGVYDQLQDIVPLLKVDMVSAFGISITYVDNDGD